MQEMCDIISIIRIMINNYIPIEKIVFEISLYFAKMFQKPFLYTGIRKRSCRANMQISARPVDETRRTVSFGPTSGPRLGISLLQGTFQVNLFLK